MGFSKSGQVSLGMEGQHRCGRVSFGMRWISGGTGFIASGWVSECLDTVQWIWIGFTRYGRVSVVIDSFKCVWMDFKIN